MLILFITFSIYHLAYVEENFIAQDTLKYYNLCNYVIKNTEKIIINGKQLSSKYYRIDYEKGVVYFDTTIKKEDTIYLSYKKLPFNILNSYSRNNKCSVEVYTTNSTDKTTVHHTQPTINIEGEKNFSIEIGNNGLTFDQSMQINLSGRISENVELNGVLKDNETPIQENGATQEFKEMDEVFVQINSKNEQLRFGNFNIKLNNDLGSITRNVQGVMAKNKNITVGKAIYPGEWRSIEFIGKTGKQGPYEVSTNGIVENSEVVHVQNKIAKRGVDYTIDYETGTITFTTKLFIQDGDKIKVEFQELTEDYKKEVTVVQANKDCFYFNFFQENNKKLSNQNDLFIAGGKKELNGLKFTIETGGTQKNKKIGKAAKGGIAFEKNLLYTTANFNIVEKNFIFPGTKDTTLKNSYSFATKIKPKNWLQISTNIIKAKEETKKSIGFSVHSFSYSHYENSIYHFNPERSEEGSRKIKENQLLYSYNIYHYTPFFEYRIGNITNEKKVGVKSEWLNLQFSKKNKPDNIYTGSIFINKKNFAFDYTAQKHSKNYIELGNLKFNNKNCNIAYNLSSLELAQYIEEYYKVEQGKGSFSKDSTTGRYYPNRNGDYQKRIIKTGKSAIYKNFSFLNEIKLPINKNLTIRVGTKKEGDAKNISLWQRNYNAISDRNTIKLGIKYVDIYTYYIKEDYRENKIYKRLDTGNKEIFRVNIKYFTYETNHIKKFSYQFPTWDEKNYSIFWNFINNNVDKRFRLASFNAKLEQKTIADFIYTEGSVFGLNIEPTMATSIKNKNIECRVNLIYWYHNEFSPIVASMYPKGLNEEWGVNFSFPYNNKTNCNIYYQGSKYTNYPIQHSLNAEVKMLF